MANVQRPERESLSYLEFYKGLVVRHRQNQLRAGMVLFGLYNEEAIKLIRLYRQTNVTPDKAAWACATASTDFKIETLLSVYELIRCPLLDQSFE